MVSPLSAFGRQMKALLAGGILAGSAVGCSTVSEYSPPPVMTAADRKPAPPVIHAGFREPMGSAVVRAEGTALPDAPANAGVEELVQFAIGRNPKLARATFAIDAAQGRYVQAGLYPNPDLAVLWDEIGDRTGAGGILSIPRISQQIVTGRKLSLSQAIVANEVNQATIALMAERYAVIGSVRAAYYDLYALERKIIILDELVKLAGDAVKNGQTLLDNKQIARLDLVQLEVERARFVAEAEAARREVPAARKRLAAAIGDPRYAVGTVAGPFEDVPHYDPDRTLETVLETHPEIRIAKVEVERAQAAIRRAEVEPIPNITFSTGYIRQYENQSHDFALGLSAPVPVWNRNQGNIRAAKAELGMAIQSVGRAENELADRVAVAMRTYSAALKRAEQYRSEILPRAEETYKLSLEAFKGGQFEYLRVVQAQRAVAEARLEYNRSLGEAWRSAADLSSLLLEEWWPGPPPAKRGPGAGPTVVPIPIPKPPMKNGVEPR